MIAVTVYSKPACVQCTATKRDFDKKGVAYTEVDLTQDDAALARLTALGYAQVPVIITDLDQWTGFRPDKHGELIAALAARAAENVAAVEVAIDTEMVAA